VGGSWILQQLSMTPIERIIAKLTSGQFLLTVCCGAAFLYQIVTGAAIGSVEGALYGAVFAAYFTRDRASEKNKMQQ